jgi:hypothetical protein
MTLRDVPTRQRFVHATLAAPAPRAACTSSGIANYASCREFLAWPVRPEFGSIHWPDRRAHLANDQTNPSRLEPSALERCQLDHGAGRSGSSTSPRLNICTASGPSAVRASTPHRVRATSKAAATRRRRRHPNGRVYSIVLPQRGMVLGPPSRNGHPRAMTTSTTPRPYGAHEA